MNWHSSMRWRDTTRKHYTFLTPIRKLIRSSLFRIASWISCLLPPHRFSYRRWILTLYGTPISFFLRNISRIVNNTSTGSSTSTCTLFPDSIAIYSIHNSATTRLKASDYPLPSISLAEHGKNVSAYNIPTVVVPSLEIPSVNDSPESSGFTPHLLHRHHTSCRLSAQISCRRHIRATIMQCDSWRRRSAAINS